MTLAIANPTANQQIATPPVASGAGGAALERNYVLSQQQSIAWLQFLSKLPRAGQTPPELVRFRDALADACWLARWNRDYVILALPIVELPAIIDQLVCLQERPLHQFEATVVVEILRALSHG